MMQAIRNSFFVVFGLFLLAGCGGSGSAVPITTGGGNLATISSQNAPAIAGVVAEVALEDGIFGAIFNQSLPIASGGPPQILSGVAEVVRPSAFFATKAGLADCAVSGTVDVQVTIMNPLLPTVGDEYVFMFTACDEGTGTVTSGTMVMTITAFDSDPVTGGLLLGVGVELSAFQITADGETSMANGTVTVEIDTRMPPITTITVSTSALATTTDGTAETVSNMTLTISEDQSIFPTAVTVQTSFTISSPRIGGDVVVSTSLALQSTGEEYPFVGELRIMAAGNSAIVLIALDSNNVRLEIDLDGDGAMDESVDTTWDEILAAAAAA